MVQSIRSLFARKLGKCNTCMRASALGTVLAWAAFAAGCLVWPNAIVLALTALIAISFTALFIAHAVAFSIWMARILTETCKAAPPGTLEAWRRGELIRLTSRLFVLNLISPLLPRKSASPSLISKS